MLSIYLTGVFLIIAVSLAVASPFFQTQEELPPSEGATPSDRWRRQRDDSLSAIREAEFDFHLGKLSEADYAALRGKLEASALEAIHALEEEDRSADDR